MASTTSITRNRKSSTRPPKDTGAALLDISHINPLAQPLPTDTMSAVSDVLSFIGGALTAMMEQDASVFDISDGNFGSGLKLILDTCQAALDSHLMAEGGAQ